jgi:hypothetical protein
MVIELLKKLEIVLPYDPLLGIYPKEFKTGYSRDSCTPMFIAALFIIANSVNNPDALQQMNGS